MTEHLPWFALALVEHFGDEAVAVDGVRYPVSALNGSGITLRHLLTHTGGLPREAGVPYWTDHVFPDSERLAQVVVKQRALWPPGTNYQYSNLGMGLLGEVVEAASGLRFGQYLDQALFGPLGMSSSTAAPTAAELSALAPGFMRRMPDGSRQTFEYYDTAALAGAANVISTLSDMARFAALHLSARPVEAGSSAPPQRAPIDPQSLHEMHTVQWVDQELSRFRGLGFSVSERDGARVASHGGWIAGHRSHLVLLPAERIAVIAMVNADDVSPSFFAYRALDVLRPAIEQRRKPMEVAESSGRRGRSRPRGFGAFEGTYSDPWGSYYEAMDLDGALYFYEHSYPPSDSPLASLTWLEPDRAGGFLFGNARDKVRFELTPERDDDESGQDRQVLRVLRRSDYLFPVKDDGSITVDVP